MSYGLVNKAHGIETTRVVCDVLGGGVQAMALLIETAQQETKFGDFRDRFPYRHGVGLTQQDPIGFEDTRDRTPRHRKQLIREAFGVDMDAVQHRELAYSPLLAFIWCRCFYKLRPGAIPNTIEARAAYWKKYYNTDAGRGTEEEYITNAYEFRQQNALPLYKGLQP